MNSIIIVALIGVAAIFFLVASFTGGGKWKRSYEEEREDHARYANDTESDLREARLRIDELKRENASLQERLAVAEKAVVTPVVEPVTHVPEPVMAPAVEPVDTVSAADPVAYVSEPVALAAAAAAPAVITQLQPAPVEHPAPEPVIEEAHFEPVAEETHPAEPEHFAPTSNYVAPQPVYVAPAHAIEPEHISEPEHVSEPEHFAAPEPVVEQAAAVDHVETPATAPEPEPVKSWFGAGRRDDLGRIRGIDTMLNTRLFGLGVTTYDDIVHLSAEDEMALEQRLQLPVGLIARDQWREQAALLRSGNEIAFNERFGNVNA